MYRDDDTARADRANALIEEIAALERQKVSHASTDQRLDAARLELRSLQSTSEPTERRPSLAIHAGVFLATAAAAFLGYTLVF